MKARGPARFAHEIASAAELALHAERTAREPGLLQGLDPRTKLVSVLALVLGSVAARPVVAVASVLAFSIVVALSSRLSLRSLLVRVWLPVLAFAGAMALPALVVVPGRPLAAVPAVTHQGVGSAVRLVLRGETAATLGVLLVLSTPWTQVLKALRSLGVPAVVVVVLGMAHRYALLLLQTAREMLEARESRFVGALSRGARRHVMTASAGVLLGKSLDLAGDVHQAMRARGYRGDVRSLDEFRMRGRDWAALATTLAFAIVVGSAGR